MHPRLPLLLVALAATTVARGIDRPNILFITAMIGKWHLGSDPSGFDSWEILPGQGAYNNPVLYTATGQKTYPGRYTTHVITELTNLYAQPGTETLTAALKSELARLKKEARDDDQFAEENPTTGPVDGPVAKLRGK